MKQILFFAFAMIAIASYGQKNKKQAETVAIPVDSATGTITYTEVIKVDSVPASELFKRAKRFFVDAYKSANDVIQLVDEKSGEITGKGSLSVYLNMGIAGSEKTSVRHTISIFVKDGRYKYEIKDFNVSYYSKGTSIGTSYIPGHDVNTPLEGYYKSKMKMHKRFIEDVDAHVKGLVEQIKTAMRSVPETKKDNW